MNQLERLQRRRRGEAVPPRPSSWTVTVRSMKRQKHQRIEPGTTAALMHFAPGTRL